MSINFIVCSKVVADSKVVYFVLFLFGCCLGVVVLLPFLFEGGIQLYAQICIVRLARGTSRKHGKKEP
jgi:hypothetical protein